MVLESVVLKMMFLSLLFFLIPSILGAAPPSPPPDPVLDQLRSIHLPHIFSPTEGSMMMNQLDMLVLGIQLFLSEERERTADMQQQVYSMIWPLVKCIFKKDFETPSTLPPYQQQPPQGPQNQFPSQPQGQPQNPFQSTPQNPPQSTPQNPSQFTPQQPGQSPSNQSPQQSPNLGAMLQALGGNNAAGGGAPNFQGSP